jgi:hypothetical protein
MRAIAEVRIAVVTGGVLLAGCAPVVRSQRDEAIPVPQGATWAWAAPDTGGPAERGDREAPEGPPRWARARGADPTGATAIPRQRFHRALEAALDARGFHRVAAATDADFVLTLAFVGPGQFGPAGARTAVSVGWVGGFGGRGRWGPNFGWYQPWGWFGPWAGWAWRPWGFGWYGVPMLEMATAYPVGARGITMVAYLRLRSSGDVAWRAQYRADAYDLAYLTQQRAREIADKLVASLR